MTKPAIREGIYRRLSVRMWGDAKFMRLSPVLPSGQSLWTYLVTGPHTGPIPGVFVSGRAAMAEALGWEMEAFDKALAEVIDQGMVEIDARARLWFIPKAIHHNRPANPNVVRSWRGAWSLLPECHLRERIAEHLASALAELNDQPAPWVKAFDEASGKAFDEAFAKASAKQEAGSRYQEAGEDTPIAPPAGGVSSTPTIPCPYDMIIALYHEILPTLPKVKLMPNRRQRALRKVWGWVLSSTKSDGARRASNADEALLWMRGYFERASQNDFLMGRTPRTAGHESWECDLDYLMTDAGMTRVIEKTKDAA